MPISSRVILAGIMGAAVLAVAPALAQVDVLAQAEKRAGSPIIVTPLPPPVAGMAAPQPAPPAYQNPQQALGKYLEGYRAGDPRSGMEALRYAAEGGEAFARWRLGSMYANGEGVPHDDKKAYEYFEQIVEAYDDATPVHPRQRGVIASAFVAVGAYALTGIPNSRVNHDPQRARDLFTVAATEFADPHAQYALGRLYLDGTGVKRDPRRGARWLKLSADKQHMESQALLGNLYFMGAEGVQRQRAMGLMYLTMARDAVVDRKKDKWVIDLYDSAMASANDLDRQGGLVFLEGYIKGRR